MHPFRDKKLVEDIEKERNRLILELSNMEMSFQDKRRILEQIEFITDKLLRKANISGEFSED